MSNGNTNIGSQVPWEAPEWEKLTKEAVEAEAREWSAILEAKMVPDEDLQRIVSDAECDEVLREYSLPNNHESDIKNGARILLERRRIGERVDEASDTEG